MRSAGRSGTRFSPPNPVRTNSNRDTTFQYPALWYKNTPNVTLTTPPGWTFLDIWSTGETTYTGTIPQFRDEIRFGSATSSFFYRIAQAGDTPSVIVTDPTAQLANGFILAYSNPNPSFPAATVGDSQQSDGNAVTTYAGGDPVTRNGLLIAMFKTDAAAGWQPSALTGGLTERGRIGSASTTGQLIIGDRPIAPTSSSPALTATSLNTNAVRTSLVIAI